MWFSRHVLPLYEICRVGCCEMEKEGTYRFTLCKRVDYHWAALMQLDAFIFSLFCQLKDDFGPNSKSVVACREVQKVGVFYRGLKYGGQEEHNEIRMSYVGMM